MSSTRPDWISWLAHMYLDDFIRLRSRTSLPRHMSVYNRKQFFIWLIWRDVNSVEAEKKQRNYMSIWLKKVFFFNLRLVFLGQMTFLWDKYCKILGHFLGHFEWVLNHSKWNRKKTFLNLLIFLLLKGKNINIFSSLFLRAIWFFVLVYMPLYFF